jgi:hypothetical protein
MMMMMTDLKPYKNLLCEIYECGHSVRTGNSEEDSGVSLASFLLVTVQITML